MEYLATGIQLGFEVPGRFFTDEEPLGVGGDLRSCPGSRKGLSTGSFPSSEGGVSRSSASAWTASVRAKAQRLIILVADICKGGLRQTPHFQWTIGLPVCLYWMYTQDPTSLQGCYSHCRYCMHTVFMGQCPSIWQSMFGGRASFSFLHTCAIKMSVGWGNPLVQAKPLLKAF